MRCICGGLLLLITIGGGTALGQIVDGQRVEAVRHNQAGPAHLRREAWREAESEFIKAIDLDPLLAPAHYGLGQAYMAMREYRKAIHAYQGCRDAYERLRALTKGEQIAARARESEQRLASRDTARASGVGAELEALRLNALRWRQERQGIEVELPAAVSLGLGSAYFRSGAIAEAEREFLAAIAAEPGLGEAHNNLAVVYFMTGRTREARGAVDRAEAAGFRVDPRFKADLGVLPRR
jgi:tetratricopeptide (TPR) repeat protein